MENATKALLMAAGVLLTMLIVMLLLFFKGKITEFYDEQGKIEDIENVEKFNKQFTNYERKKVYGYELISLANMVEDYNTRHSAADGAQNDEKYKPITLVVSFEGSGTKVADKIWFNNEGSISLHLFKDNTKYIQSEAKNEIVGRIINEATAIENLYGNTQIVSKLAKSIDSLIIDKEKDKYQIEKIMKQLNITEEDSAVDILRAKSVEDYKKITNDKTDITYAQLENILLKGSQSISIKQYYEYYQFKRAVFDCDKIEYDNNVGGTGRIIGMTFKFTGKVE